MVSAIGSGTKAMASANKAVSLPKLQKQMMEFERQNQMLDTKQDMRTSSILVGLHQAHYSFFSRFNPRRRVGWIGRGGRD